MSLSQTNESEPVHQIGAYARPQKFHRRIKPLPSFPILSHPRLKIPLFLSLRLICSLLNPTHPKTSFLSVFSVPLWFICSKLKISSPHNIRAMRAAPCESTLHIRGRCERDASDIRTQATPTRAQSGPTRAISKPSKSATPRSGIISLKSPAIPMFHGEPTANSPAISTISMPHPKKPCNSNNSITEIYLRRPCRPTLRSPSNPK